MNPLNYFRAAVTGQNTLAGLQASDGGTINVNFNGSSAAAPSSSRPPPRPFSTVPFPPDDEFVDRPKILSWMRERCTRPAARIALVGLGGVGKSQLAIRYAHEIHKSSPDAFIFWVHASSRERFEEAYQSIAERLDLPGRHDRDKNILQLVHEWLCAEENGKWHMFVDNADDVNLFLHGQSGLASYLPTTTNGTVVVTSRSMDAAERLTGGCQNIFKVPAMETREAYQLLLEKLDGDNYDEEAAADLAQALENIPLAITQAAAFINRAAPQMSLEEYLDELGKNDSKKTSLLNKDAGDLRRDTTASNSIVTTWQMTFEQIRRENPSAADLLCFMSFFNSQGIPEYALQAYVQNQGTGDLTEDLQSLRGYALVSVTRRDLFEMHALVQFCTKVWISSFDDLSNWKMELLRVMSEQYPIGSIENWALCQELNPHIEEIIKERPDENQHQIWWAKLLMNVGWYRRTRGRYRDAETVIRRGLETRRLALGDEHPETLSSMTELGIILKTLGEFEEAEKVHRQAHETSLNTLGRDHLDTVLAANELACTLWRQGKNEEAREIYEGNLEVAKRVCGEDAWEVSGTIHELALVLVELGEYKEAEHMFRQVLESAKQHFGDEHVEVFNSMGNIGATLQWQEKYEEAEEMYRGALAGLETLVGPDHHRTLSTRFRLVRLLYLMSRAEDAAEHAWIAYEAYYKARGPDHKFTQLCWDIWCWAHPEDEFSQDEAGWDRLSPATSHDGDREGLL